MTFQSMYMDDVLIYIETTGANYPETKFLDIIHFRVTEIISKNTQTTYKAI